MSIREALLSENLITHTKPTSPAAEAFRTFRTNLQYTSIDKKVKSIVITSPEIQDGKTVTSSNLAISIANTGKKVLLVDADLRKPNVHNQFKITNSKGLTHLLVEELNMDEVLYAIPGISNLHVLTSGIIPPNPSELLSSNKMKELVHEFTQSYDMVIIDTPPIGLVSDGVILSRIVDGVVITVLAQKTKVNTALNAAKALRTVEANILGVVLTKMNTKKNGYYEYKYV